MQVCVDEEANTLAKRTHHLLPYSRFFFFCFFFFASSSSSSSSSSSLLLHVVFLLVRQGLRADNCSLGSIVFGLLNTDKERDVKVLSSLLWLLQGDALRHVFEPLLVSTLESYSRFRPLCTLKWTAEEGRGLNTDRGR
jgi:hypothetical protein